MIQPPADALSQLQEVRDLIYAAKVEGKPSILYIVDGNYPVQPSFNKYQLTETAHLVGNTLFLNLVVKLDKSFRYEDNLLLPYYNVGGGRNAKRYIFTNYFHAWGYFQRMKQRLDSDQQKSRSEFLGPQTRQLYMAQGTITGRLR